MTKAIGARLSHTIHTIKGTLGKPPIGSLPRAYFPETDPHPVNGVAKTRLHTAPTTDLPAMETLKMNNPFLTPPSPVDLGSVDEWDFVQLLLVGGGYASGRRTFTDGTTVVLHDCSVQSLRPLSPFNTPKMAFNMANIIAMMPGPKPAKDV